MNAAPAAAALRKEKPGNLAEVLERCIAPHIHENRQACIAEAAYFIAQRRGFAPGHELDDWLEAENEVDARLTGECAY
ncbi:MAG: DUF2934 domain-containing protein [Steroidobacteraceae bacterium]